MATFSMWFTGTKKTPAPRQITWVCGPEVVLVEDIVSYIVGYLAPEPWNLATLVAGEDSEREIWAALDQHPMGSSPRVVVLRHVERIQSWERFIQWVKDRGRNPRTYLVLVSSEESVPKEELTAQQRREHVRPGPLPHIAAIGTKGHVVECKPFTPATALKSVEWVVSKAPMRDVVARYLLTRTNWNLRMVRDTCLKAAVFPGEVTAAVITALVSEQPRDTLADALMALDRKTALLAAEEMDPNDLGRLIGLLDSKLDTVGTVHDMMLEHRSLGEMAKALGPQAFLLNDLMKVSKHYDTARRHKIRKVLAIADEAHRSGATTGVIEAVISLW